MTHKSVAQRSTLPVLERLRDMKDGRNFDATDGMVEAEGDETPGELLPSYTPKQREALLKGFRILARVAVRTHMEQQAAKTASDDSGEEERDDGFASSPHRQVTSLK